MAPRRQTALAGALLFLLPLLAGAQIPIPGKYYEYYVIARTGGTFTGFGNGPSINDSREVAFQASNSLGGSLWVGTGNSALVNFNPSESFLQNDVINTAVQINSNHQVVSQDRITDTTPNGTNIRLHDATALDSFTYMARGGPFGVYDSVFANPAVNQPGDVVFTAYHPTPAKVLGFAPHGGGDIVERTISSGNPKPMIADDGTVVIQVGNTVTQSNRQILVYPPGLGSPIVLADTNDHWLSLDNDPGISRDGRIVAFQGNLDATGAQALGTTSGPGIFAAVNEGSGFASARLIRITGTQVEDVAADNSARKGNLDGVCDPGETCKAAAELGFDANGNPITLASYGSDSRVGVVNVDFGAAGIDDDTFVISFIATPGSASRDNPALPGTPLLFSAQQGLWTIRVDVQHQLAGSARVYHPYTPIPVVQVGDRLGQDTITAIKVYDPIANAAYDEYGIVRTMRRGDHRVAFWASTNNGQIIVRGNHLDSDQDGLLDHWETTGIDMDQDGVVDLKLSDYGADPFVRDVFLQVDWVGMPGFDVFKPTGGIFNAPYTTLTGQYSMFEANLRGAEALTGDLYGARVDGMPPDSIPQGIVPHVDAGAGMDSIGLPLSLNLHAGTPHGGNYVGMSGNSSSLPRVVYLGPPGAFSTTGIKVRPLQDIKNTYLGTADKDARLLAFRYAVFVPFQDFTPNYPAAPFTATVHAVPDASSLEIDQTSAGSMPSLKGNHVILITGAAADTTRLIGSTDNTGSGGRTLLHLTSEMNPLPGPGDQLAILDGSTGVAEVAFAPSPDHNSLPGNDFIVAIGAMGVQEGLGPNPCIEGGVFTHELGHTLGLRHGGTDQNAFKAANQYTSVMSYTNHNMCRPPLLGVASWHYSQSGDPTFDDFAHLEFNFQDVLFHLTNSLGNARGQGYQSELQQQDPEPNLLDILAKNGGSLDTVPPSVAFTAPPAAVYLGSTLTVNVTATDNLQVAGVTVSFDANGNGVLEPAESVAAAQTGPSTYRATFPAVSGAAGTRTVRAIASDSWANTNMAAANVTVIAPTSCDIGQDALNALTNVQLIINEATGAAAAAHDLDGNGAVNVVDVQIVMNAALNRGCTVK